MQIPLLQVKPTTQHDGSQKEVKQPTKNRCMLSILSHAHIFQIYTTHAYKQHAHAKDTHALMRTHACTHARLHTSHTRTQTTQAHTTHVHIACLSTYLPTYCMPTLKLQPSWGESSARYSVSSTEPSTAKYPYSCSIRNNHGYYKL